MPVSVPCRRLFLLGSWTTFLGIILYALAGSLSRNVYILDAFVVLSLSMTFLGLVALMVGGVMWAWRVSIAWMLLSALTVGGLGLLVAEFGDINVHGPTFILAFVVLAAVTIGVLVVSIAVIRFVSNLQREKA